MTSKPTYNDPIARIFEGVEWVWFDLDDTIYDFHQSSLIGLRRIYDLYGLDRYFSTPDQWIDIYHKHNAALWDLYNRGLTDQPTLRRERFRLPLIEGGADETTALVFADELDELYLDLLGSTGLLLPYAREALEHLRACGYCIGILSNGFTGVQNLKLCSSGIEPLVDCLVLSDEININKPDRRLFDYAVEKAATSAERSIMVGDNPATDIAGAVNAGWRALLFNPSGADTECEQPQISSLSSLLSVGKSPKI